MLSDAGQSPPLEELAAGRSATGSPEQGLHGILYSGAAISVIPAHQGCGALQNQFHGLGCVNPNGLHPRNLATLDRCAKRGRVELPDESMRRRQP